MTEAGTVGAGISLGGEYSLTYIQPLSGTVWYYISIVPTHLNIYLHKHNGICPTNWLGEYGIITNKSILCSTFWVREYLKNYSTTFNLAPAPILLSALNYWVSRVYSRVKCLNYINV